MELVAGLREHGVTSFRLGDFSAQISPLRIAPKVGDEPTGEQTQKARTLELLESV